MPEPHRRRRHRKLTLSEATHAALDERRGDASRWVDQLVAEELRRIELRRRKFASTGGV